MLSLLVIISICGSITTDDDSCVTLMIARRLIEAALHGQIEPGKRNRFVLPGSICPFSSMRLCTKSFEFF